MDRDRRRPQLLVRPIRPEDEPRLVDMVGRSSPNDIRLRFLGPLKEFPHLLAARLSQIDYDRELALIAVDDRDGHDEILGVSRIVCDPEGERAEFAVMVRSDMKGKGLGFQLMKDLLAGARCRGVRTLYGDVLAENTTMLAMAAELGFSRGRRMQSGRGLDRSLRRLRKINELRDESAIVLSAMQQDLHSCLPFPRVPPYSPGARARAWPSRRKPCDRIRAGRAARRGVPPLARALAQIPGPVPGPTVPGRRG